MVIAIYCRKSVYRDTSDSISNQIEMCRDFIERNYGTEHTILVYDKDEGISGATTERPCFQQMMTDIQNNIINMVVCYMIDRISRNIKDFCNIYFTFQEHNCRFVSVKENIDDTTPMGRAMLYICQVFANLERDNTRERIVDNMEHIESMGYWASGLPPFGYDLAKITAAGKKHTVLAVNPDTSPIYLHMVDLFLNKHFTLYAIERELMSEGYRTAKGHVIDSSRIWKILSNPSYMCADGEAYEYFSKQGCKMMHDISRFDGKHGIMVRGRFEKQGTKLVITDKSEWKIYVSFHEPLISSSDWIRMQDNFKGNVYSKKKHTDKFGICSGIIKCSCGYSMRSKNRTYKPTGHDYTAYVCTRRDNKGRGDCKAPMVKCELIDTAVIEQLKEICTDKNSLINYIYKDIPKPVYNIKDLKKRLKELTESIKNLTLSLADAGTGPARKYIVEEIEKLDEEKMSINAKLTETKIIDLRSIRENENINRIFERVHILLDNFETLSTLEKNQLIRSTIKEVVVDGKSIKVTF